MATKIYQIQIALKGSKPKIWRRILVPSDLLLSEFHKVIQTSMGWTNSHLHQFVKNRTYYAMKSPDDDTWGEMNNVDYEKLRICDLLKTENEKIGYEYDFGDGWEHEILLEKIMPSEEAFRYPICLTGKNNCPPEDCGGVWGYAEMLDILKNPKHEEYENYREWLGDAFDPKRFDAEEVNELLKSKDFGVISW